MILLRNVKGTSRFKKPTCASSWLEYWKDNFNISDSPCCAACGCEEDLVGAHVQKVSDDDESWYIVPLCKSCNKQEGSFEPIPKSKLAPMPSNQSSSAGMEVGDEQP